MKCGIYISRIIAYLIVSLTSLSGQKHTAQFNHLAIVDGLSNSYINCMLQDSRGFMWFGTQDGLNKYDGYEFTVYKYDPLNSYSLSDNYVRTIIETRDGFLWIGTESGGINKFDPGTETFTHYLHDPDNLNSLSHNSVKVIAEDTISAEPTLWLGTIGAGVDKFNPRTNTFSHYKHDPDNSNSISNNDINAIHIDRNGHVWVGTLNGLNKFDTSDNSWESYQYDPEDPTSISHSEVYSILEGSDGTLLFGTLDGMDQFQNGQNGKFTHFDAGLDPDFEATDIQSMLQDQFGRFWIGTFQGLRRFDKKENEHVLYQHHSGDPSSLSDNNITSVLEDRSGFLWVGTGGGGINKMKPNAEYILHYSHIPGNPNSLSQPSVRGIYEDDDGILWVGGYGGLNRINRTTGDYRHFRGDESSPDRLNTDAIFCIKGDPENKNILWLGSEGEGLFRFEKGSGKIRHYFDDDAAIRGLLFDPQGRLWAATSNGLGCLDTATNITKIYNNDPSDSHSLSDDKTTAIYQDSQQMLWIGTLTKGLNQYDPVTGKFKRFTHQFDNPRSISINRIKSIYEDRSGILWIGTNGGGLNRFDRYAETFSSLTTRDGLPNDVIYGILEDSNSNLWLSTNLGLSRFNPKTAVFKNYDVNDGLQSNEFNTASYFLSRSGEMFFGGINGFNAFYPERIVDETYVPPIIITDFSIFNESVPRGTMADGRTLLKQHITETTELSLSYKDAAISFEFTALSYAAPLKNRYAYKMEGFDKNWIYTDASRRYAGYTKLNPGMYVFRVIGSNHDGVWNDEGTRISISIAPPLWKTWWAYSVYIILGILLISGSFQLRVWQMTKKTKELEVLVGQRTAEIRNHEQKLQNQYDFLNSVIESLAHPFYVIDVASNQTVLTNTAAKRKLASDQDPLRVHPESINLMNEVKKTHQPVVIELEHTDTSGKHKIFQINAYPVFGDNGEVVQVIKYWLDISERKALEDNLKESLQKRNQELTSKAMRMAQDKEVLIAIVRDVQHLFQKCPPEEKASIRTILARLNEQINSDNQWDEFELWFQEVHRDFFVKLNKNYPDLVPRELKICAFLKLNLSTKEIANLTNLTVKTIEVYRSTIRKKLQIPPGENFSKFIHEL